MTNPLRELAAHGQSVWLDSLRRGLLDGGELARLVEHDGLGGVTSNPAIFEKVITGSGDYREALPAALRSEGGEPERVYEALALEDVRRAADVLRPVYEASGARDGFVSLEVSPHLAHDTEGTCRAARRLFAAIDRPNAMIKVPATRAGVPAIERLLAEGIPVNVTLLFSNERCREVREAHLRALEARLERGEALEGVASVASVFLSRIDAAVEREVETQRGGGASAAAVEALRSLCGRVAVSNARLAYRSLREALGSERWRRLAESGASPQRLLWASTAAKSSRLRDVHYVEALVGPDTVTTLPPATLDAAREHARVVRSVDGGLDEAESLLRELERHGLSMAKLTEALLEEGLRLFEEAYDRLLEAIAEECRSASSGPHTRAQHRLPPRLLERVQEAFRRAEAEGTARRVWARDASLWTGGDEAAWLGWLCAPEEAKSVGETYAPVRALAREGGYEHVVLLGMGGSSLGPEVLAATLGSAPGFPELLVLDSTHPGQVATVEEAIDPSRTLFLVSSKSGGTLEPNLLLDHFHGRVVEAVGAAEAGGHFVAITDPGSSLEGRAHDLGFRAIYAGEPSIGGRYSVLSPFGLVPAALTGLDVGALLDRADEMAQACSGCVPAVENPGLALGVLLGTLAREGRDKLTILASPRVARLGAWLEQLLAESTGKAGRGLVPVDGERPGPPEAYGGDRIFAFLRSAEAPDAETDAAVERLASAGHPVVQIDLRDGYDLAREFFRWEFATAVAGALLGVNPFDQPDVEASKEATRALDRSYEEEGALPAEEPFLVAQGEPTLAFHAHAKHRALLEESGGPLDDPTAVLGAHLATLGEGGYLALLVYLPRTPTYEEPLQALRHRVRDAKRVATCLGYGPRFLHSTGQAYKGGPKTGVFLEVTSDWDVDLALSGRRATLGVVNRSQALGDFRVLGERGRRALRIHVGGEPAAGLRRIEAHVAAALGLE